jgi:hypothetical protein
MYKLIEVLSSRWLQFVALPLMVLGWFVWTDPSEGADTLLRIQLWMQALLITGMAYLISKALLGASSSEELYMRASGGVVSAGIAYLGVCLLRVGVLFGLLVFFALIQR